MIFAEKIFFIKIIVILSFMTSFNFAQRIPELITDRPDQTESALVVPIDALQIEMGFAFQKQKFSQGIYWVENDNLILGNTLCRYGVNSFLELRFGGEYFSGQTVSENIKSNQQGVQNLLFGAKVNLRKDEKIFSNVGVIIQTILPFGNEKFRPDNFSPAILLTVDQKIDESFSFGCNIGMESSGGGGKNNYLYTGSLAYDVNDRIGTFFEFYGSAMSGLVPSNNLDCGVTYLFKPNVQVDISFGTTLIKGITDFFGGFGIALRLPD